MTEILLTGSKLVNKQVKAAVMGLIALIFDSKSSNVFANSFIKNQLSIIRTGKEIAIKICY